MTTVLPADWNPTLKGLDYRRTHRSAVIAILGSDAPPVSSRGSRFYNVDRWTLRVFVREMCRWAQKNKECVPTRDDILKWVEAANREQVSYREIVIANTPERLSRRTALALTGGAYHEAFHTYYSCRRPLNVDEMAAMVLPRWAKVPNWSRYYQLLQEWNNIIEDIRIERLGGQEFPGIHVKMCDLQDFILAQEAKGLEQVRAHSSGGKVQRGTLSTIMVTYRDVGLGYSTQRQREALAKYQTDNPDAVKFVLGEGKDQPGPLTGLLKQAIALDDTDDTECVRIALDVIGVLHAASSEEDPANDQDNDEHQAGDDKVICPSCGAPGSKMVVRPKSNGAGGKVKGKGVLTCTVCGHQQEVDVESSQDKDDSQSSDPDPKFQPQFEGFDPEDDKQPQSGGSGDDGDKSEDGDESADTTQGGSQGGDDESEDESGGGAGADDNSEGDDAESEDGQGASTGDDASDDDASSKGDQGTDDESDDEADDEAGSAEADGEDEGGGDSADNAETDDGSSESDGDGADSADGDGADGEGADGDGADSADGDGDGGDAGTNGGAEGDGKGENEPPKDVDNTSAPGGGHNYEQGPVAGNDWSDLADAALEEAEADKGLQDNNSALEDAVNAAVDEEEQRDGVKGGEAPWRPYDPGNDEFLLVRPSTRGKEHDRTQADLLYASVKEAASFLRARLRQIVRALEIVSTVHGVPRGRRLSSRFLVDSKVALKDRQMPKRAYWQRDETLDTSLAAAVVLDQSGSMYSLLQEATQMMCAITEPLDALGCPVQVSGFRDGDARSSVPSGPAEYHRYENVVHDIFKLFDEPLRVVKWRFANTRATGGTPMADGIQFALDALSERQEGHRVMFVITDGQPNGGHRPIIQRQIRLATEAGIHVVGVGWGAGSRYVERLFPDSVWRPRASEIPEALIIKLNELIDLRVAKAKRGRKVQPTT